MRYQISLLTKHRAEVISILIWSVYKVFVVRKSDNHARFFFFFFWGGGLDSISLV